MLLTQTDGLAVLLLQTRFIQFESRMMQKWGLTYEGGFIIPLNFFDMITMDGKSWLQCFRSLLDRRQIDCFMYGRWS